MRRRTCRSGRGAFSSHFVAGADHPRCRHLDFKTLSGTTIILRHAHWQPKIPECMLSTNIYMGHSPPVPETSLRSCSNPLGHPSADPQMNVYTSKAKDPQYSILCNATTPCRFLLAFSYTGPMLPSRGGPRILRGPVRISMRWPPALREDGPSTR